METQRPSQISTTHLNRRAIEYRRSSTLPQTVGTGNAAQARFALRWGWPTNAIEIIDEEPGGNGGTMEHRPGYQRLCQLIAQGDVGVVLVSDVSRLTRSIRVWQDFVELCQQHATLIAVDDHIVDGADPSEALGREIRRAATEWERSQRIAWLHRAKQAKALAGSNGTA